MSEIREITSGVHWVGVRHPELAVFDELFPTRYGSTYNSYLVQGTEKIALIDTVKGMFTDDFLDKVTSLVPLDRIDLVVVNHTEPDHSGALTRLLELNPGIEVYCTKAGQNFLGQLGVHPEKVHVVSEGETVDLGGRTLQFILAPYLHWPDTMFTYLREDEILFSCDAFGAHFCSDGLYDDEVSDHFSEFAHYFDTIMRPFKDKIREAVSKLEGVSVSLICPSHGPIWRKRVSEAIDAYRLWSAKPESGDKKQVLMLTLSPHGNTRLMAGAVRKGLEAQGLEVNEIALIDTTDKDLRDAMERADGFIFATPTINRDAPPAVWQSLALLSTVTIKSRMAAVFGAYGWSGEAVNQVEQRLKGLKFELPVPGMRFRFTPEQEDYEAGRALGENFARALLEKG